MKLSDLLIVGLIITGALYIYDPGLFSFLGQWIPQNAVAGQIIITYADGHSQSYQGSQLAVATSAGGAAITNVQWIVKCTPSWTTTSATTMTGVTWSMTATCSVDGVVKTSTTTMSSAPTTITKDTAVTVLTWNISGSQFNGWIPFDQKTHPISFSTDVTCSFTPTGESAKTISGNAMGNLTLQNIGFPATLTVTGSVTTS